MFKRTITYIFVLFFFVVPFAQKEVEMQGQERIINRSIETSHTPKKGDYLKDSRLDAFQGIYKWLGNTSSFYLELKIAKVSDSNISFMFDYIVGVYSFIDNCNCIVESKGIKYKQIMDLKDVSQFQVGGFVKDKNKLELGIKDKLKNKDVKGILIKNDDGTYTLSISDIKKLYTDKKAKEGFTLPETMVLTKTKNYKNRNKD